ncbi:MAG: hypothetical protein JNM17_08150 [Archangium sp.]|nr:hypothetical protein [Archangium sp.]
MKTAAAPASAWEVRMRWGDRSLEAEVVDGRGRKTLSLGEREEDDFVIGNGARLHFTWTENGLEVRFSTGIAGTGSIKGAEPVSLGQLVERGVVKESSDGYFVTLAASDSLALEIGGQHIEVRQTRGRVARLRIDALATVALIAGLALLGAWLVSTLAGMTPLNLIPKEMKKK